jgi:hypothetical protein
MTSFHRSSLPALSAISLWLIPELALAGGWYIGWDCVGECAGYGTGNSGIIGPFPNEEECERVRHTTLSIPDDSLFHHYCEYIDEPSPPTTTPSPSTSAYDPGSSAGGAPTEIELSSLGLSVLVGPGWAASDESGTASGHGSLGFGLDLHTGPPFMGATFQLGIHGTRIEAPLIGDAPRAWFVAPASVGIALTPRLLALGSKSLWLDLGASVVGFAAFGCDDCPVPVFSERFGYGGLLEAGVDVMLSEETGVGLQFVAPRYGIGDTAPGDLRLTSPRGMARVSIVGRFSP